MVGGPGSVNYNNSCTIVSDKAMAIAVQQIISETAYKRIQPWPLICNVGP